MKNKDREQIVQEYKSRQDRQYIAVATALFLVMLSAVIYKRPDLFGAFSKNALFGAQAIVIGVFVGFTAVNWRCPACDKYLGSDINRKGCNKCGARLR